MGDGSKRWKSSSSPMEACDVVFEIMSRLDAASLARASCVCNLWRAVASHEKLWEALCVLHWPAARKNKATASLEQIRCVVAGLGGFRSFFSSRLGPIVGVAPSSTKNFSSRRKKWGSDEVHLSLSLYSIDCFMKRGDSVRSNAALFISTTSSSSNKMISSRELSR